jgi:hypothetical protein
LICSATHDVACMIDGLSHQVAVGWGDEAVEAAGRGRAVALVVLHEGVVEPEAELVVEAPVQARDQLRVPRVAYLRAHTAYQVSESSHPPLARTGRSAVYGPGRRRARGRRGPGALGGGGGAGGEGGGGGWWDRRRRRRRGRGARARGRPRPGRTRRPGGGPARLPIPRCSAAATAATSVASSSCCCSATPRHGDADGRAWA